MPRPDRPSLSLLAVLVAALAAGCGGGPRPATTGDFEAFQDEEAAAERGLARARDEARDCLARRDGADATCDAADRHCNRAHETDDDDARRRCREVERMCAAAESTVLHACAREPAGDQAEAVEE